MSDRSALLATPGRKTTTRLTTTTVRRVDAKCDPKPPPAKREVDPNQRVFTIFKRWDATRDTSPRLSAVGPIFVLTRKPAGATVTRIAGDFALTERLLSVLQEKLPPNQTVIDVSAYQVSRAEGVYSMGWLVQHGLWLIQSGRALKVRQHHQYHWVPVGKYSWPVKLETEYHCPGATKVYPFIEPGTVYEHIYPKP